MVHKLTGDIADTSDWAHAYPGGQRRPLCLAGAGGLEQAKRVVDRHPVQRCPTSFHARGQFGLGDVLLLKNLLELERNHALEGQHFHVGKDAFPGEEIAEVTATVGILICFGFY